MNDMNHMSNMKNRKCDTLTQLQVNVCVYDCYSKESAMKTDLCMTTRYLLIKQSN